MSADVATFDAAAFDVLTIGRVGVDLYPLQSGTHLQDVETFGKFLGGSPTNVAVAAARLGRRSAVITRTGRDPFGIFIHQALRELGVDDRFVSAVDGLPTPITFCEIFPPDDFPLYFYRYPVAPDLQIQASEIDLDAVRSASVYWSTVTGLSAEPSRSAHFAAWEARGRAPLTILDLDYRPMFWNDPGEAHAQVDRALSMVTVAVGNREECEVAVGESDPDRAAEALLDRGIELAIVKQGPQGCAGPDRGPAGRGAALPRRGGQRPRRRRRLRRCSVPRTAQRLVPGKGYQLRQRRRGDRRFSAGVLDRDADGRRGRGSPRHGGAR